VVTVTVAAYGDAICSFCIYTSAILDINTANDHAIDFTWGSLLMDIVVLLRIRCSTILGKGFATPLK
jgi:hypothetical protein